MGVFEVEIKMNNWLNMYLPENQRGMEVLGIAIVDTGAIQLCIPVEIVEKLKLVELDEKRFKTADGSEHIYRVMGIVLLEVMGRKARVEVIELPRGSKILLGALPLEEMDWHISPLENKLLPNPESPNEPLLPLL